VIFCDAVFSSPSSKPRLGVARIIFSISFFHQESLDLGKACTRYFDANFQMSWWFQFFYEYWTSCCIIPNCLCPEHVQIVIGIISPDAGLCPEHVQLVIGVSSPGTVTLGVAKNGPCWKQLILLHIVYIYIYRLKTFTGYISFSRYHYSFLCNRSWKIMHIRRALTLNVILERNVVT
jgi:hypothetical protein